MQKARLSVLAVLFVGASASAAMADAYTFTTITRPTIYPGDGTRVTGINDVGQIVGSVGQADNTTAFIEDLATGAVTVFSGVGSFGTSGDGINNQGVVVGSGLKSGGTFGYVRDPVSGAYTLLPEKGGFPSGFNTTGINDAGQIVGNFRTGYHSNTADESYLYDPVTGTSSNFVDPDTGPTSGYIGPSSLVGYTHAFDINNRGQIVGATLTKISPTATVATPTGFLLDVATNIYTTLYVPGSTSTSAFGINDVGQVVGSYQIGSATSAFLLDLSTGTYTTLTDPAATSTVAYGINNAGQIVGAFLDASGNQNGFVATPTAIAAVPEPASLALLGGNILALIWARRTGTDKA